MANAIGEFFFGTPARTEQFQTMNPGQQGVQGQILQQLMQLLQQGAGSRPDYSGFAPIEQNARTQFNTQTVPGLAERFTSMGGAGTRGSSDFAGSLGAAGAGLEQGLGALKAQYGQQQQGLQQNNLRNLLGYGFQPSFENKYFPSSQGFVQEILRSLVSNGSEAFGKMGGQFLGSKVFGM